MSTQKSRPNRENMAPGYGVAGRNPLTLHHPDRGVVIDVWDRTESKAERQLTDKYQYRVEVAQKQETQYSGVFAKQEVAERIARELTYRY